MYSEKRISFTDTINTIQNTIDSQYTTFKIFKDS
jgi:hypothetical protein